MSKELQDYIESLGLNYSATFIPHKESRNKKQSSCLNWIVSISKGGSVPIITDYMQGIGHIPWFCHYPKDKTPYAQAVEGCCNDGNWFESKFHHDNNSGAVKFNNSGIIIGRKYALKQPKLVDVLWSLVMDSDVLNYSGFEDWADSFGYDTDSRLAEKTYNQCMDIALQMNSMFDLDTLQELFQDY